MKLGLHWHAYTLAQPSYSVRYGERSITLSICAEVYYTDYIQRREMHVRDMIYMFNYEDDLLVSGPASDACYTVLSIRL